MKYIFLFSIIYVSVQTEQLSNYMGKSTIDQWEPETTTRFQNVMSGSMEYNEVFSLNNKS